MRDARRLRTAAETRLAWEGGAIVLAGNEAGEVIAATGPGKSTDDRVPMAIFRRQGTHAEYVWAVSMDGTPVKLAVSADGIAVESAGARWSVRVDVERAEVKVTGGSGRGR